MQLFLSRELLTENEPVALHHEAVEVTADASEGFCSLCKQELVPHDGLACCRCCGIVYSVGNDRLGLSTYDTHSRDCEHMAGLWERWRTTQ